MTGQATASNMLHEITTTKVIEREIMSPKIYEIIKVHKHSKI